MKSPSANLLLTGSKSTCVSVEVQIVSPALPCESLRFGRDRRRRQAHPGSYGAGDSVEVVLVDAPEGGMRIVAERPLHAPLGSAHALPNHRASAFMRPRQIEPRCTPAHNACKPRHTPGSAPCSSPWRGARTPRHTNCRPRRKLGGWPWLSPPRTPSAWKQFSLSWRTYPSS